MLSIFSTKLVSKIAENAISNGYLRTKSSRNMSFSLMDIQDYVQEENASQWGRSAINQFKNNGNNFDVFNLKTVDTRNSFFIHSDLNSVKNINTISNNKEGIDLSCN